MIEKDDWRLLNDVQYLKLASINSTDGEEIFLNASELTYCMFCHKPIQNSCHERWYVTDDISCCICEECFHDFKDVFKWNLLDGWDIDWDKQVEKKEIL